ncbi:hypothetical protein WAJ72_21775, partial [Acinetobacter baumannii]
WLAPMLSAEWRARTGWCGCLALAPVVRCKAVVFGPHASHASAAPASWPARIGRWPSGSLLRCA